MAAATTVVRSSTATTASIGRCRANRATASALASGSPKSRVTRDSGAVHVDQRDDPAVAGDRRIDHRVDQFLNASLEFCAHGGTSRSILYPSFRSGPTGPRWAPLSRTRVR